MLYLLSFVVFSLAIAGMALGVLFGRRPITGSCGRDCSCRPEVGEASESDAAIGGIRAGRP